jgi:hypothetical protein
MTHINPNGILFIMLVAVTIGFVVILFMFARTLSRLAAYRRAHGKYRTMLAEANFCLTTPKRWHDLRCHPSDFEYIYRCVRNFHVVANDRDFLPGDGIRLREYAPTRNEYTGRVVCVYILGAWNSLVGVKDGHCVMSIRIIAPPLD